MTVAELIAKLSAFNPELPVRIEVYTPADDPDEIESEETLTINDAVENDGEAQLWAHDADFEDAEDGEEGEEDDTEEAGA